jgi:hypothetical protein
VPLDSRKVAHIAANRARIRAGRSETVVFVGASGGSTGYVAVDGVVWHDEGLVPAGVETRAGQVTRRPWDAIAEFPGTTVFPSDLRLIARTASLPPLASPPPNATPSWTASAPASAPPAAGAATRPGTGGW